MCYEHQEPWHAGQTCEQYDNYKRHGDPNFESTASWMQSNTKECPGCSRSIQKIDGCDHMTCKLSSCSSSLLKWPLPPKGTLSKYTCLCFKRGMLICNMLAREKC